MLDSFSKHTRDKPSLFTFLRASFEFDQSGVCIPGPGWRVEIRPTDHLISDYEFDVIIGADGRRSTLDGKERFEMTWKGRLHRI